MSRKHRGIFSERCYHAAKNMTNGIMKFVRRESLLIAGSMTVRSLFVSFWSAHFLLVNPRYIGVRAINAIGLSTNEEWREEESRPSMPKKGRRGEVARIALNNDWKQGIHARPRRL
jgi:hypothetical protein